jgi:hypothetical protein
LNGRKVARREEVLLSECRLEELVKNGGASEARARRGFEHKSKRVVALQQSNLVKHDNNDNKSKKNTANTTLKNLQSR